MIMMLIPGILGRCISVAGVHRSEGSTKKRKRECPLPGIATVAAREPRRAETLKMPSCTASDERLVA